jgi:Na+-transporting NADH:ubiquinone oxidoreductase subunit NqrB
VYKFDDILSAEGVFIKISPKFTKLGNYFFPELVGKELIFIEYNNPNPKGRLKKMSEKLPITSKIMSKNMSTIEEELT